jgi:hypothetical protein
MRFCPNCGAQRPTQVPFCAVCGADLRQVDAAVASPATPAVGPGAPAQNGTAPGVYPPLPAFVPPMPPMPRASRRVGLGVVLAAVVVTAVVALSGGILVGSVLNHGGPAVKSGVVGSAVFAAPEDAIRQYMNGVAANDADQILQACGIDEVASKFQWEAWAERLQAILPWSKLAPSQYPLYATENQYARAADILLQVRNLAYGLLSSLPTDGTTVAPVTKDQVEKYAREVDPSLLAGLKVLEVKFPIAHLAGDARTLSTFAAQARVYGADEMTERLALFELNGKTYEVGFQLLRYGSSWIVLSQSSALSGLDSTGVAKPISQSDFDAETGS